MHIFLVYIGLYFSTVKKAQNLNGYGKPVRMFFAYCRNIKGSQAVFFIFIEIYS